MTGMTFTEEEIKDIVNECTRYFNKQYAKDMSFESIAVLNWFILEMRNRFRDKYEVKKDDLF